MSFLTLDTAQLYYERTGTGPALVFIHDGLLHSVAWEAQVLTFAPHYTVIRYDRRGYGQSAVPTQPYSHLVDLHNVLTQLQIRQATLIGSSSGGGLALAFALAYPEMVQRLVLVGAILPGFGFSEHFIQRERAALTPLMEFQDVQATIAQYANDPYLIAAPNTAARVRLQQLMTANAHNLTSPHELAERTVPPTLAQLTALQMPTLLLVGEADIPDVHAHAGAIQIALPHAYRVVLRQAGHLPYFEQPEALNEAVQTFLAK